jgi:hypothetical protein
MALRNGFISIAAPTGVGKSTRFISTLNDWTSRPVVVVEPRHILVEGLTEYMTDLVAPKVVGGSTSGMVLPKGCNIIYGTVQSLLQRPNLLNSRYLWVIDEAHLDEPHYDFMKRFLENAQIPHVRLTATPDPLDEIVELEVHKTWSTDREDLIVTDLRAYAKVVIDKITVSFPTLRWLVFVPSLAMAETVAGGLSATCCLISSKSSFIDPNARVFISTKVSDAGLTIPDVDCVMSTNVDVQVNTDNPGPHDITKTTVSSYYKLSETTLIQRVGRVGRTRNGSAFIYHVTGMQLVDKRTTAYDELIALGSLVVATEAYDHLLSDPALDLLKCLRSHSMFSQGTSSLEQHLSELMTLDEAILKAVAHESLETRLVADTTPGAKPQEGPPKYTSLLQFFNLST